MAQGREIVIEVTKNPTVGSIESWKIYNFTPDAHPIYLHLVQFNTKDRQPIPGVPTQDRYIPACPSDDSDICYDKNLTGVIFPQEKGWKDTVIAHPGQVTTVRARFDIEGLYVWHCHTLEHEDNEMMRPFFVKGLGD